MDKNVVSPYELAVLVVSYLEQSGYRKTAASFRREAKAFFRGVASAPPPPGVRSLLDLLNEYVQLKERSTRRLALAGRNPLAARLLAALDAEAGEQQGAVEAAAQAEQAAQAAQQQAAVAAQQAQAQWLREQQAGAQPPQAAMPHHFVPLGQHAHFAAQAGGQLYASSAAAAGRQGAVTPGRQRKGAPRKRQRGAASPAGGGGGAGAGFGLLGEVGEAGGSGSGWGSPTDLLNLQLDAEGLEALLDDGPLQLRFAENLAQHINDNLGGGQGGVSFALDRPGSGSGSGAGEVAPRAAADAGGGDSGGQGGARGSPDGGFMAELLADPQMVLAELPADPLMAEVLQAVVRPSAASPTPPSAGAGSRPASQAADRWHQVAAAGAVAAPAHAAPAPRGRRQKQQAPRAARPGSRQQQRQEGGQEVGERVQQQGTPPVAAEVVLPIVSLESPPQPQQLEQQQQQNKEPQQELQQQQRQQEQDPAPPPSLPGSLGGQPGEARPEAPEPPAGGGQASQADGLPAQQQQALGPPATREVQQQPVAAAAAGPSTQQGAAGGASGGGAAAGPAPAARPRSQQVLLDSGLLAGRPSSASSPAKHGPSLPTSPVAASSILDRAAGMAHATDPTQAAAQRLLCGLEGLGPVEVAASEDQMLQDIDDLF